MSLDLSKYRDTSQKKKFKDNEKCSSTTCIITRYDTVFEQVSCDRCSTKFHTMCEALTPIEEITAGNVVSYICISCSNDNGTDETCAGDVFRIKLLP